MLLGGSREGKHSRCRWTERVLLPIKHALCQRHLKQHLHRFVDIANVKNIGHRKIYICSSNLFIEGLK